ncbi:MAG: NAD-dependent deacylase [Thermodesulfovibrionales bacterium]
MEPLEERLGRAAALLREASAVAAFTGAGISTESGLSDFRSPGGIWDRYRTVTFQEFLSSREARVEYWSMKRELFRELAGARPNAAHAALAELERMGKLLCVITQNIDGLHQDAGSSPEKVVELHGTNRRAACLDCGRSWPMEEVQARLEQGDLDPRCGHCGGLVKPATVSFGQPMPEEEMRLASRYCRQCDLMLMVGSSLQVEPAASLPRLARQSGARLVFINRAETPWDHLAEVLFRENAGPVLGELVARLRRPP